MSPPSIPSPSRPAAHPPAVQSRRIRCNELRLFADDLHEAPPAIRAEMFVSDDRERHISLKHGPAAEPEARASRHAWWRRMDHPVSRSRSHQLPGSSGWPAKPRPERRSPAGSLGLIAVVIIVSVPVIAVVPVVVTVNDYHPVSGHRRLRMPQAQR